MSAKREAADMFIGRRAEAFAGQLACRRISAEQIEILGELQGDLLRYCTTGGRLNSLERTG